MYNNMHLHTLGYIHCTNMWVECVLGTHSSADWFTATSSVSVWFYAFDCVCSGSHACVRTGGEKVARGNWPTGNDSDAGGRFSFNALPHMDNQALGSNVNYIYIIYMYNTTRAHSNGDDGGVHIVLCICVQYTVYSIHSSVACTICAYVVEYNMYDC